MTDMSNPPSGHEPALPGPDWARTAQLALLASGIVAPLLYLATDVIAGIRWEGCSFRDQTISELNASGAPTRPLTITLGLAGLRSWSRSAWGSGDRLLGIAGYAWSEAR